MTTRARRRRSEAALWGGVRRYCDLLRVDAVACLAGVDGESDLVRSPHDYCTHCRGVLPIHGVSRGGHSEAIPNPAGRGNCCGRHRDRFKQLRRTELRIRRASAFRPGSHLLRFAAADSDWAVVLPDVTQRVEFQTSSAARWCYRGNSDLDRRVHLDPHTKHPGVRYPLHLGTKNRRVSGREHLCLWDCCVDAAAGLGAEAARIRPGGGRPGGCRGRRDCQVHSAGQWRVQF